MKNNYLWTQLKSRLLLINSSPGTHFNWLFLPGGPGLGSESLTPLTKLLNLPGSTWSLDLPGDGSNVTNDDSEFFSHWSEALEEAVSTLENVILVAHSTGGMYALSTPSLEKMLTGLVLMDSSPSAKWQELFMNYVKRNPIPELDNLHKIYAENPNNEILKKMTLLSTPYLFTESGLQKDIPFLESLPYNFKTCEWSAQHFDSTYEAKWIPKNIPTLILSGEKDRITPLSLFENHSDFKNSKILIRSIKNAGHFPWIENPEQVVWAFEEYCKELITTTMN